jgi:hypothetical protein
VSAAPGSLASSMEHASVSCELALAMDATLEASERDLVRVRMILRLAVEGLAAEFGQAAQREGVEALQFQDRSERILASVARRIGLVRSVLGREIAAPGNDQGPLPGADAMEASPHSFPLDEEA